MTSPYGQFDTVFQVRMTKADRTLINRAAASLDESSTAFARRILTAAAEVAVELEEGSA